MTKCIFGPLLAGGLAVAIATPTAAGTGRTSGVPTHGATVTARIRLPQRRRRAGLRIRVDLVGQLRLIDRLENRSDAPGEAQTFLTEGVTRM
jgi:hypothetical protein